MNIDRGNRVVSDYRGDGRGHKGYGDGEGGGRLRPVCSTNSSYGDGNNGAGTGGSYKNPSTKTTSFAWATTFDGAIALSLVNIGAKYGPSAQV